MPEATARTPYSLLLQEGDAFSFLGSLMTLKATADSTGGAFGLIEQLAPPGFAAPPHVHHAEDEAFYLIEGDATFSCGDLTFPAHPGSFIWLPRDVAHWFRVEGDAPARLLQWNSPAGLERFFVEMGEPVRDRMAPPAGPPDVAKLLQLASRYKVEIQGPPAH